MHVAAPWLTLRRLGRLVLVLLLPAGSLGAKEREADESVAVLAQVFNGYKRTRLPDRSFKPETYTFGEGGCWTRPVTDSSMAEMTFLRVAHAVAAPLARLNYRPAGSAAEAELMILVFWGATEGSRGADRTLSIDRAASAVAAYSNLKPPDGKTPPSDAANIAHDAMDSALSEIGVANAARDELDERNARILGYTEALERARFAPHMSFAQDTLHEVSDNRYYVVLQAYDFKTAAKEKKLKPLWTVRLSMAESGNNFGRSLEHMLRNGAQYFGQDSDGLHRDTNREGQVEIGPLQVVEPVPVK